METQNKEAHPWRARLTVGLLMLILAFIGLIITDLVKDGAWIYWRAMVPVYAILSLALSLYLRSQSHAHHSRIWQEVLHWIGLILAVYIVSTFVNIGLVGRYEAGLQVLAMLALTTFLAGIYHDIIFLILGVILGVFTLGAALFNQYLYTIMLPITILAGAVMIYVINKNIHHPKAFKKD